MSAKPQIRCRDRRYQVLRVGMGRRAEDRVFGSCFNGFAEIHDHHRDMPHDGKIMGDEQHRQIALAPQPVEQIDDLRLDRDVEGRDRLVTDEERRPSCPDAGQRSLLREISASSTDIFPPTDTRRSFEHCICAFERLTANTRPCRSRYHTEKLFRAQWAEYSLCSFEHSVIAM